MRYRWWLLSLLIIILFSDCSKTDSDQNHKYGKGIFVLNEGPFQTGTGTLTYIDDDETIIQNVFETENNGLVMGNIAQSMIRHNDRYYFVINNAGKIIVTDLNLKVVGAITGLSLPRYMIAKEDKGYITQWGENGTNGALVIVDLNTLNIVQTKSLGNGPEEMVIDGDQLIITNGGSFDLTTFESVDDSTVMFYNIKSNVVDKTVELNHNPNSIVKGDGGYYICSAGKMFKNGKVQFLNQSNDEIADLDMPSSEPNRSFNRIRYLSPKKLLIQNSLAGTRIYEFNDDFSPISNTVIYLRSYNVDADESFIYVTDAKDFNSAGEMHKYDFNGNLLKSYQTGIIPRAIMKL